MKTMASNIQQFLNKILSSRYGKDVRKSIHDGIQQCYDDVNNPDLNTEAFKTAVQSKIDDGTIPAMTIPDGSITKAKLDPNMELGAKVDNTLKNEGEAADAKVTGDAIGSLYEDYTTLSNEYGVIINDNVIRNIKWEQGSLYSSDGSENDNLKTTRIRSDFIEARDAVGRVDTVDEFAVMAFLYDEDKNFVRATGGLQNTNFTIDGKYIRFVGYIVGNSPITTDDGKKGTISYPKIKTVDKQIEDLRNPVKKLKYVAFGDSLTIGRRSDDLVLQTDRAYPAIFGKYFNYDVVNLGVGGQGLTYNDTQSSIQLAYDYVVAHQNDIVDADLITFKWGNNDRGNGSLDGCVNAYKQIFDYVKSVNPYARIVVLSPNNVTSSGTASDGYWLNGQGNFTLNAFHVAIGNLCKTYGIVYIDVNDWSQIDTLAACLGDNVHPKDDAYEKYHRHVAFCIASSIRSTETWKSIDLGTFTDLTYIDKVTGEQKSDTSIMSSSDFIRIASKSRILFNDVAVQNNASICEYDASKRYLRTLVGGSWATSFVLETSEKARYIRITAKKLDESRPSAFYVDKNEFIDSAFEWTYLTEKSYPLTKVKNKAIITMIDDDTSTQATIKRYYDVCKENAIKGTFSVITLHTEADETLKNMLLSYEDEGFGMLYHCYSQESYWGWSSAYDLASCEQNYCRGNRLYKDCKFTSGQNMFIAPFGQNKLEIQNMAKRHGAECLISTDNNILVPYDNMANRFNIPRCSLGHNDKRYPNFTIEQLKTKIDEAYNTNGWIIITTHTNEWGETTDGEQRFTEIVNYAKNKGLEFKTFAEAYEDRKAMFYAYECN